jgi:beta-N-acetylhexosaminidase
MANNDSLPLVVGLPGPSLDDGALSILGRILPSGVILFARNIESFDQVTALVGRLGELEPRPFVAVDLEGGAVNRLENLWGALPSPAEAGAAGRRAVRALGDAAGAACRSLGIHLDLAPVVDLDRPHAALGREGRCFSDDSDRVIELARVFSSALEEWGVGGCLKHFPGLGTVVIDTHDELPVRGHEEPIDPHLRVFEELSEQIPLVMMAHVVVPPFGDTKTPASLSRRTVDRAAELPGAPVVLSDDLEMGALDDWGDLPQRVVAALRAHNHGVLVCKAFDRLEEIADHLREEITADSAFGTQVEDLAARLGTLRRDLCRTAAAIPAPDEPAVAKLWEAARQAALP